MGEHPGVGSLVVDDEIGRAIAAQGDARLFQEMLRTRL
jgi:hypothetical protein